MSTGEHRIAILCPSYGPTTFDHPEAVLAAVQLARNFKVLNVIRSQTSILPDAFNQCLAKALDMRDEGRITHMAMIHSDIIPDWNWLNILHAELVTRNADLISQVVPIKSDDDKTSTAIGSTRDPWLIKRHIETTDRGKIPETFSRGDVCREDDDVLLVNTGLFLADLRRPWWDGFAFNFVCKIVRDDSGKRISRARPEDWEMSRMLHSRKAHYFATWRVPLRHRGTADWDNPPLPSTPSMGD